MTNTQYTKYPPTLSWITLMCTKNSNHHHSGKRQCHSILQLLTFLDSIGSFAITGRKIWGKCPPLQLHGCKYLRDDQNWTFVRTVHGIHPYREIILQKFPIQYSLWVLNPYPLQWLQWKLEAYLWCAYFAQFHLDLTDSRKCNIGSLPCGTMGNPANKT